MAYVYFHYVEFELTPFYVGIGSDQKHSRAFDHKDRTKDWHKYRADKVVGVKIIEDYLSWEDACKAETKYIKLFGRLNNGTGCLVNKNNGGKPRPLKERQKSTLSIRIDDELMEFLTQLAKKNYTTVSRICSQILTDYYENTNPSSKTTRVTQKSNNPIGTVKKGTK